MKSLAFPSKRWNPFGPVSDSVTQERKIELQVPTLAPVGPLFVPALAVEYLRCVAFICMPVALDESDHRNVSWSQGSGDVSCR